MDFELCKYKIDLNNTFYPSFIYAIGFYYSGIRYIFQKNEKMSRFYQKTNKTTYMRQTVGFRVQTIT